MRFHPLGKYTLEMQHGSKKKVFSHPILLAVPCPELVVSGQPDAAGVRHGNQTCKHSKKSEVKKRSAGMEMEV